MPGRNQVRIIGGQWRRRHLHFPSALDLRPTPDRVRETVFNWLGQTLENKRCLDLFAGSGALGFEAASRGAELVVMIEHNREAYTSLGANVQRFQANNIELHREDALRFLALERRTFDIVFLDPPYRQGLLPGLLVELQPRLAPGALVYAEGSEIPAIAPAYRVFRQSQAGRVKYLLLEFADHASEIQQNGLSRNL